MDKIAHFFLKKRLIIVIVLVVFLFTLLFGRLFYLQVVWSEGLQYLAYDQWTRELPFRADRGDIVDSNGIVLAKSSTVYTLYARPNEIDDPKFIAENISSILGVDAQSLEKKLSKTGVSEITVAKNLSKSQMLQLISTVTYLYGHSKLRFGVQ